MKDCFKSKIVYAIFLTTILLFISITMAYAADPPPDKSGAVRNFANDAGADPEIDWDAETGVPTFITGKFPADLSIQGQTSSLDQAYDFFNRYGNLFQMKDPAAELALLNTTDADGSHIRFQQMYEGIPVWGAQLLVHSQEGQLTAVNGHYQPGIDLDPTPVLTAAQAETIAREHLGVAQATRLTDTELVVMTYHTEPAALTWLVQLTTDAPPGRWLYFIDAHTGGITYYFNNLPHAKNRRIHDAAGACLTSSLPGTQVATEATGGSLPAGPAKDAFNYTGATYDYFLSRFGRDSYNGSGGIIITSVKFGTSGTCNSSAFNAFWNGTQLVFGSGGNGITHYAKAPDVVAHEFTHAVTEYTAGLIYQFEQGALNESISDIFGTFTEQRLTGNFNDWQLGEDTNDIIRDMSNPPLYNQPAHMSNYNEFGWLTDSGGVHINSGIPNKAAYLMVAGGTFSGISVSAVGLSKTEQIFYRALNVYLSPLSGFNDAKNSTIKACKDLIGSFGITAGNCNQVQNAWAAVGLGRQVITVPNAYKIYLPVLEKQVVPGAFNYEPNDDVSQAYGPLVSGANYLSYLQTNGDVDIFHFTTSGGFITISLSSLPSGTNYDLELYNSAGTLIDTSYNAGTTAENISRFVSAGKYYVYISPTVTASSKTDSYLLKVTYP
ncbi:MAG: peptidase M4 family protein [Anaerolineae bacterium]|nr:peptidase M4 family protein [Anaerolineae bacterium]